MWRDSRGLADHGRGAALAAGDPLGALRQAAQSSAALLQCGNAAEADAPPRSVGSYSAAMDLVSLNAGITSSATHWNCSSITRSGVHRLVDRLMCCRPGKRASSFFRCSTRSPGVPANQAPSFMKCSSVGTPALAQPPRLLVAFTCSGAMPGTKPSGANILTCSSENGVGLPMPC